MDANTDYKDVRSVLRKFIIGEAFSNIYIDINTKNVFLFFFFCSLVTPIHFKQDKLLSLLLDTLQKTTVDMSHKYYTVKI